MDVTLTVRNIIDWYIYGALKKPTPKSTSSSILSQSPCIDDVLYLEDEYLDHEVVLEGGLGAVILHVRQRVRQIRVQGVEQLDEAGVHDGRHGRADEVQQTERIDPGHLRVEVWSFNLFII